MSEPEIVVRDAGNGVAVVLLSRPAVLNAITASMARSYALAMRRLDADDAIRAIVVSGAGRGFCAGADLSLLAGDLDALRAAVPARADLPGPGLASSTPVIAAANGPVAGIGLAYLLGSDIRFADPDTKIATAFPRLGLVAEYGLAWLLTRLIGLAEATELLISGRTVSGVEAHRIGLVQHVSAPGQALDEAIAYARSLSESCSSWSLTMIKAQLQAALESDYETALTSSLRLMDESFRRDELRERIAAHQARAPQRSA